MSVIVRIPSPLQSLAGERQVINVKAKTVIQLIDELEKEAPGIKTRLLDENGQLRRFVNVYVDEEDIRFLDGLATKLDEGIEVSIVPAVAGG